VAEHKYPRIHTRFSAGAERLPAHRHAKSICLNFGIAREFGGICNFAWRHEPDQGGHRIRRVHPGGRELAHRRLVEDRLGLKQHSKVPEEKTAEGKKDFFMPPVFGTSEAERKHADVKLEPFYASDYFDQIYECAVTLIKKGKAFVCDMTPDQTDEYRRSARPRHSATAAWKKTSTCSRA